jgi:hypothetical protein
MNAIKKERAIFSDMHGRFSQHEYFIPRVDCSTFILHIRVEHTKFFLTISDHQTVVFTELLRKVNKLYEI